MTPVHHNFIATLLAGFFADQPKETPSQWCEQNLWFNEPDNRGPFSFAGREYARESVDDWANPNITDQVEVFGSQTGKTGTIMGGAAWTIRNEPSRLFWVMATRPLVLNFSRTRWMPMLRRSPLTMELIPFGARRNDFTTFQQQIGNSIVDFVWSNSPAALSSTPARVVILDEVDKFMDQHKREADALNLAEQRTKNFANPKRVKTSTPTILEGLIWQEFLKTDQRRRFLPCPHCQKFVVFVWSKQFTIMPIIGSEAFIQWDKEAKRADGSWDLDRVDRSARAVCPHCAGHITDGHKTLMDRAGVWRPTANAARGYRGRHLPSLYASAVETSFGALARKFLQAKHSLTGLQGFINGDLAEPYQSQDRQTERMEIISSRVEVLAEWRRLMTIDCQAKRPYFWFIQRAWDGSSSEGYDAGPLDTWDEVRSKQQSGGVPDFGVCIDTGFGARSEREIYVECARFGEFIPRPATAAHPEQLPKHLGWLPAKGMPIRKRWKEKETGLMVPYYLTEIDPYGGSTSAGQVAMDLFEFSSDYFADILDAMRRGQDKAAAWTVKASVATDEYWKHLDSELKMPVYNRVTGVTVHKWQPRSKHWPNHLKWCERLQIAYAAYLNFFKLPSEQP